MTTVFAPGRVNLIGEHTDYTGGLVLPMALELGVTFTGVAGGDRVSLSSEGHQAFDIDVQSALEVTANSGPDGSVGIERLIEFEPSWARYVLAAANRLGVSPGVVGELTSTLPIGGTGLSSSTALTCAALLLYGASGDRLDLAQIARSAEIDATGLEIGLMDQAASLACRADHALLMDCHTLGIEHIVVPESLEVLVVHSGHARELVDSEYGDRRDACLLIEKTIGPLRVAGLDALSELSEQTLRKRARHVITENQRVRTMIDALAADDPVAAGRVLIEGHTSLADDYEVSIPAVDEMVAYLNGIDGVYGARMTGGGFGGSIVALCRPGTSVAVDTWWTRARPGAGARILDD